MTDAQSDLRQTAEREAKLDLQKPPEQFLTDIHEELLRTNRPVGENLAHANKRMASLTARAALSSDLSSKHVICLTWVLLVFTAAILILTFLMWQQNRTQNGQPSPGAFPVRPQTASLEMLRSDDGAGQ